MALNDTKPQPIEDLHVTTQLSGLTGGTSDRTVTLSGRCGKCGYLLGSPGHKITCEAGAG